MSQQSSSPMPEPASRSMGFPMAVAATIFFMFGFATSFNTILQPHLKGIFSLNYAQAMLVQTAFFSAYFVLSLPLASLMGRIGYQKAMVVGLAIMGVGAFMFLPAADRVSYPLFLSAIWVLAGGVTMLQVSANPFVTQLGPGATAPARLNLAQAFNSVGTTLAPYLGGILLLSDKAVSNLSTEQKSNAAALVKTPYLGMGIVLLVLAAILLMLRLNLPKEMQGKVKAEGSIWQHRHLVLGALGIFAYVGAEVSIGSIMVNYLSQPFIGGLTEKAAATYVSLYWGGMIIGRFVGTAILHKISGGKVLGTAALIACLLVLTTIFSSGLLAMWSVVLVGLFNSVMFPTTFSLAVQKLGPLTGKGSGLINMAIVGGAIIPPIQGYFADMLGIQMSFLVPAICYLYIMFYGFSGSKVKSA